MPQPSFESTDLPDLQARTHCVLIPRDPNYIYAYWNYAQGDIDGLRDQLKFEGGGSQLILRVYDITLVKFNGSNANHAWDLDVGYSIRNWYIHVWQDNAEYCAELGLRYGENSFIPLARSNIVNTPPKTASKRNDLIWQDIKAHRESQPFIKENIKDRYQGLMQQQLKKRLLKLKYPRRARIYQLTAQDIREYYMKLFNWVSRRGRRKVKVPSIEDIIKGKLKGISWQKVRPSLTCPELISQTHPGSSKGSLGAQGASEKLSGIQSTASEGRLIKRKFFFEIWTELIVHGRTEADAAVWLNQKGVKLNPDGTFSLHYALPDGNIPLKFIAQSSDGIEERKINTGVEREKTVGFTKMKEGSVG